MKWKVDQKTPQAYDPDGDNIRFQFNAGTLNALHPHEPPTLRHSIRTGHNTLLLCYNTHTHHVYKTHPQVYNTHPSSIQHSPIKCTTLTHHVYNTHPSSVQHSPIKCTTLTHHVYNTQTIKCTTLKPSSVQHLNHQVYNT